MVRILSSALRQSRLKPLAACVASVFVIGAPTATLAATVTSCLDDRSPGTLRKVIEAAAEGATVDFAGLNCPNSKISLAGFPFTTNSIVIAQKSLTIDGSGAASTITIDASTIGNPVGSNNNRVLSHYGNGTLNVKHLVLSGGTVGNFLEQSYGGCLASKGNVVLDTVTATSCNTTGTAFYTPQGGAVSVSGNLTLLNSTITESYLTGANAAGGGAYVGGDLTLGSASLIVTNKLQATDGTGRGGGAFVKGNLTMLGASLITVNTLGATNFAYGGGAYVFGKVVMQEGSKVKYNHDTSSLQSARGGGLFVRGDLTLAGSSIVGNATDGASRGGGAFVLGNSSVSYSEVSYNVAYHGSAGGLWLGGATNSIVSSTVRQNSADDAAGGIYAVGNGSGQLFALKNSTVSGNTAKLTGGLVVDSALVKIFNSTIAFNIANHYQDSYGGDSQGLVFNTTSNAVFANLQSTLISSNGTPDGGYANDLSVFPHKSSVTFNSGNLAAPANNLVSWTRISNLPTDTKRSCPHLGRLRNNGGLAWTHALMSNSVAIDAGDASALGSLYDERGAAAVNGTLDYARVSGSLADIGAYEVQQNDVVFNTDFEDCPPWFVSPPTAASTQ